jgi:hypothetical protein
MDRYAGRVLGGTGAHDLRGEAGSLSRGHGGTETTSIHKAKPGGADYMHRWVNTSGEIGPWSETVATTIAGQGPFPGGLPGSIVRRLDYAVHFVPFQ